MNPTPTKTLAPPARARGFTLIITISLLVLLTLVAIGLLSLSSVTLRISVHGESIAIARSNARLGMMIAIGEIQKELGPDQRISAVSEILNTNDASTSPLAHSHLTGVWTARNEAIGSPQDFDQSKSFRKWLVSSVNTVELAKTSFATNGALENPVVMVAKNDAGHPPTSAGRIPLPGKNATRIKGNFAWWVADENAKGFTNPVDTIVQNEGSPTVSELLSAAGTPSAYGMRALDPAYPANSSESAKVLTSGQLALASKTGKTHDWFHDLSPYSQGLLTNVVTGGLREDLSLFLEQSTNPWLNKSPTAATGPNGKYALSPIEEYDVLSWKDLYNYYHLKERVGIVAGRPTLTSWQGAIGTRSDDNVDPKWNAGVMRPGPVLVRAQMFFAFGSILNPDNPNASREPKEYVLRFYAYPVITLWNPYNVDLTMRAGQLNYLMTAFPMEHDISINGTKTETFNWRNTNPSTNDSTGNSIHPVLKNSLTLKAGESKMLSPTSWQWNPALRIHCLHQMETEPFRYSASFAGGEWGNGNNSDKKVLAKGIGSDRVKLSTRVSTWENGGGTFLKNYVATFDLREGHGGGGDYDGDWTQFLWGAKIDWLHENATPKIASPDRISAVNEPSATFREIFQAPKPFMVVDLQLKAMDEASLPNKTWRDCIPSHPFQGVTKGLGDATPYFANAYKLKFESINSYPEASAYLQVAPDDQTHTYFGGSYFPDEGQSWITDREIPLAAFTSLAQLQNIPQHSIDNMYSSGFFFQNHAIGNSFASPGVSSSKIKDAGWSFNLDMWANTHGGTIDGKKYAGDYFHVRSNIDRSYAANHLLWDDYFFSSMAAQSDIIRPRLEQKNLRTVVTNFFTNGTPLPNQRYRPYLDVPAAEIIPRYVSARSTNPTGYKEVAANLLVDGAFNINSVSVPAWKTMLAAAHQRNIVVMEKTGKPKVTNRMNYLVSRFSMPNQVPLAGSASTDASWQGVRELSEAQIEELAQAIVKQVKLRGPFRSLAEFVNRRLGTESDERTKYGALQAALEDPKVTINARYRTPEIVAANIRQASYKNKTAALGSCYQGAPPYVTQADLLNSIGSIITPRADTFLVRGYGEAVDAAGNILATARCEAVVQRMPTYLDQADKAITATALLKSPINKAFGRKFNLLSFRWLAKQES